MPGLPSTVLIVDLETTEGENPKVNEIGAVYYNIEKQCIISSFSALIATNSDGIPGGPNTISQIDPWLVEWCGLIPNPLNDLIADRLGLLRSHLNNLIFIAHNTDHEKQYIEHPNWLCTYRDFDLFPPDYVGKRDLFSMAIANGVGIAQGHRAIYDCLLIAEVFNRRPNLVQDFEYAQLPHIEAIAPTGVSGWKLSIPSQRFGTLTFQWDWHRQGWFGRLPSIEFTDPLFDDCQALIAGPDVCGNIFLDERSTFSRGEAIAKVSYADKDLAKEYGFRWHPGDKTWRKDVNLLALNAYPFPLEVSVIVLETNHRY